MNSTIKSMPVWKWALLLLASFILSFLMYGISQAVFDYTPDGWAEWPVAIALAAAMLALYALFVKWIEKHPAEDIPLGRCVGDSAGGLCIGVLYFTVLVLIMWLFGIYHFEGFGTDKPLGIVSAFFMFLMVGVGEEIIFRGVLFRWIDEKFGFAWALAVSSLLFGLIHIFQPGASWWSSLAIAVEAGLLLGATYKYSGTLWLPIGIHWAWNFTQGNIFGFAVSGGDAGTSLIQAKTSGPEILSGGAFGAEASLLALLLGLALSIWFIVKVVRKSQS